LETATPGSPPETMKEKARELLERIEETTNGQ
jgi:hypothetical protein